LSADGEVVRQMYDALAALDLNAFTALLDPDVTWTVPGTHSLAGTTSGVPELLAHLAEVAQRTGGQVRVDVKEVVDGDRYTVAVVAVDMTVDGTSVHDHQVHLFEIRHGRIASVREYHGDERASDALFGEL
jgi:ketosteroid isomerase-like protein